MWVDLNCTCGGSIAGSVQLHEDAELLRIVFASRHSGDGHRICGWEEFLQLGICRQPHTETIMEKVTRTIAKTDPSFTMERLNLGQGERP